MEKYTQNSKDAVSTSETLSGGYVIRSYDNRSQVVDTVAGGESDGTNVTLWTFTGAKWQTYNFSMDSENFVRISPNHATDLYLDVQGGYAGNGVNLKLWDSAASNNGKGLSISPGQ